LYSITHYLLFFLIGFLTLSNWPVSLATRYGADITWAYLACIGLRLLYILYAIYIMRKARVNIKRWIFDKPKKYFLLLIPFALFCLGNLSMLVFGSWVAIEPDSTSLIIRIILAIVGAAVEEIIYHFFVIRLLGRFSIPKTILIISGIYSLGYLFSFNINNILLSIVQIALAFGFSYMLATSYFIAQEQVIYSFSLSVIYHVVNEILGSCFLFYINEILIYVIPLVIALMMFLYSFFAYRYYDKHFRERFWFSIN